MPPTASADLDEPTLSQRVKERFQPQPPAREVSAAPKQDPPKDEPPVKEPAAKEPPAIKETVKEPAKGKEEPPAPPSEDDAVFGKTSTKTPDPKKGKEQANPNDDAFEKELAEETKGMTPKAHEKWVELRRGKRAAEDKAKAAEDAANQAREEMRQAAEARQGVKQDEQAPKLEALNKELETLRGQLAEAEKTLSVTQVERSKRYREQVSEPIGELTKQVEDMATRYEVSPKSLLAALKEDPKTRAAALKDLVADFEEGDRMEIYGIARQMDSLEKAGEKLREKAKQDFSALEDEDRAASEREQTQVRQSISASAQRAWDEAAQTLAFLNANPAAPEWTAALETARHQAENWTPGQDHEFDGRVRAQAAQHPFLVKALQHKDKQLAALTEERDLLLDRIKQDGDHDPGLSSQRDDQGDGGDDEGDEGLSVGQRVARKFGGK